jgi:hypothetical protein
MLFDPFEEKLDFPPFFEKMRICQSWVVKIIGQKDVGLIIP